MLAARPRRHRVSDRRAAQDDEAGERPRRVECDAPGPRNGDVRPRRASDFDRGDGMDVDEGFREVVRWVVRPGAVPHHRIAGDGGKRDGGR